MAIHNLMTGAGFDGGAYSGAWLSAWGAIGILGILAFLVYMFKVKADYIPIPFSFAGCLTGILAAILVITFTGWTKVGFIVGVVVFFIGGYLIGRNGNG